MRIMRLTIATLATVLSVVVPSAPASARTEAACHEVASRCLPSAPRRPIDRLSSGSRENTADARSGRDWGAAGVGAATVLGAFAIGTAGVAVVRRRRTSGLAPRHH
jgi:hypothetical protein